jgi:hypothetical protein
LSNFNWTSLYIDIYITFHTFSLVGTSLHGGSTVLKIRHLIFRHLLAAQLFRLSSYKLHCAVHNRRLQRLSLHGGDLGIQAESLHGGRLSLVRLVFILKAVTPRWSRCERWQFTPRWSHLERTARNSLNGGSLPISLHGGQRRRAIQNGCPTGGRARAHSPMAAAVVPASLSITHLIRRGSILLLREMGGHGTTVHDGGPVVATTNNVAPPRLAHFAASPAVMPRCREMCGRSPDEAEGPPPPPAGEFAVVGNSHP